MKTVQTPLLQFAMVGAREVVTSGMPHIEKQVVAIEAAVTENPGLAFDLSKTVIESVCKAILTERGHGYDEAWDLPRLLKETAGKLRLVPEACAADPDAAAKLRKTLGGLQTTVQGICELRNTHGFASHGKDASVPQLELTQALLVARSADTIVNFLFHVHREYGNSIPPPRLEYARHFEFNDYVDDTNDAVRIFEVEYRPSEVLFAVDQDAYRNYLASYNSSEQEIDPDADGGEHPEAGHG